MPAAWEMPRWSAWRPATSETLRRRRGAPEGLVLARTGLAPQSSTAAGRRLTALSEEDQSLMNLRMRYSDRQRILHGECFYHEYCQPVVTERLISETADYVRDAERLAQK